MSRTKGLKPNEQWIKMLGYAMAQFSLARHVNICGKCQKKLKLIVDHTRTEGAK